MFYNNNSIIMCAHRSHGCSAKIDKEIFSVLCSGRSIFDFRDRIIIEHDYISRMIRNVVQINNFRLYQMWCHYARIY